MDWPLVTPITGEPELARLVTAARDDGQQVISATHVVRLEDDIVGYFGLGGAVAVTFWLHSKKVHPRQSLGIINVGENLVRAARPEATLLVPLDGTSPFNFVMERLGFTRASPDRVFLKKV